MIIMEKRLNDDGRKWRHVYKALVLLEYLLVSGSDRIFQYAKDNFYVIKTLIEFQYRDEIGVDHGQNVRMKAKKVSELLTSPEVLNMERSARKNMDARRGGDHRSAQTPMSLSQREENEINQAIQESLKTSSTVHRYQPPTPSHQTGTASIESMSEQEQIQRAIELSQADQQQQSTSHQRQQSSKPQPLIDLLGGDDHSLTPVQPNYTGDPFALPQGNPFSMLDSQPTGQVFANDLNPPTGNPFASMQQQQQQVPPQMTGYSNVSSQFTGWTNVQPQPTGWTDVAQQPAGYATYTQQQPNQFTNMQHQPGFTNIQQQQSTGYIQQQSTGFTNIQHQSTGFTNIQQQPTGYTTTSSSTANPFNASTQNPIVDLDNLVGPANRNPFAISHHQTGPSSFGTTSLNNGGFNWTNAADALAPKLSLAQMQQLQQQPTVSSSAQTGPQFMLSNQFSRTGSPYVSAANTGSPYLPHASNVSKPINNNNPFF